MARNRPLLRVPPRGELLLRLTQRFPQFNGRAIELLNSIKLVSQIMDDTLSLRLEKYQLSEGKFFVLCYLFTHDILGNTAPGPSEIAENLSVTRATITGLLDGLERAGLVRRIEQVSDRRTVIVEISAQAKLLLEELLPSILDTVQPIVTERLTEAEQTTLLALLTKLESPLD